MNSENQNKVGAGRSSRFEKIERIPPLKMLLYMSMAGMGILFLVVIMLFLHRVMTLPFSYVFKVPKLFSLSTVILLVSGFFIHYVPMFYRQDNLLQLKRNMRWTLVLGIVFTLSQVVAWYEMTQSGVYFSGQAVGTYLYLLSAMHLLHLAGGLAFLSVLFLKVNRAASDPIRHLVYIRDPFRRMQLEMLRTYWHFMDGLWLALYFVFVFAL
ncbi:cytochrome c oxidase subunit III [Nibribacter ruber]|uniref:Cytochrome c oxidase subunit III n=1 Tax=Nibribacter ruber TaxID=2698458 RepID=A0A6P1NU07_9BACT|nr:cytochrome c oxidase subunit 3 [Nibribacter ruber]QHL86530.1 cytochrome c oxidase subunit III [Nibribacter ruber]